ncbi:MAG TPA: hypothetical protein VGR27_14915 [Longimicrobiaceae bacterium]|nr:hypothetical protein [Longimicrobiaceae bacterium]
MADIDIEKQGEQEQQEGDAVAEKRGSDLPAAMQVREEDLEPHAGLRYIARLFKVLAILLVLMLIAEIVLGLVTQGREAVPTLLVEATRLIVFAGLLWGAGDMALMLIESNHDLRATRILVGRLNGRVQRLEEATRGATHLGGGPPPAGPPARDPPPA